MDAASEAKAVKLETSFTVSGSAFFFNSEPSVLVFGKSTVNL